MYLLEIGQVRYGQVYLFEDSDRYVYSGMYLIPVKFLSGTGRYETGKCTDTNSSSRTEKKLVCCQAEKKKQHHQLSLITFPCKIFFVSIESPAPLPLSPPLTPSPVGGVLLAWPLFWPGDICRRRPSVLFASSGALNHVQRKALRVPHRTGAGRPVLLSSGSTWTKSTV